MNAVTTNGLRFRRGLAQPRCRTSFPMMTNELHLSSDVLTSAVEQFAQQGDRTLFYPLGLSQFDNRRQWLVQPRQDPAAKDGRWLRIVAGISPEQLRERITGQQSTDGSRQRPGILLGLGIQTAAGYVAAVGHFANGAAPLERVVVGPGLLQVPLAGGIGTVPHGDDAGQGRDPFRSRTVGALGVPAVRRLQRLSVTVVGCGRLGSLLVAGLVPLGIQRLYVSSREIRLHFSRHLPEQPMQRLTGLSGRTAVCDVERQKQIAVSHRLQERVEPVLSVLALSFELAVKREPPVAVLNHCQ